MSVKLNLDRFVSDELCSVQYIYIDFLNGVIKFHPINLDRVRTLFPAVSFDGLDYAIEKDKKPKKEEQYGGI